jgi:hypothetical protein
MKIISKYKDYYDYLQGIYGVDNKVILDRTKGTVIEPNQLSPYTERAFRKTIIAICGRKFDVVISHDNIVYIGGSILKIATVKKSPISKLLTYFIKDDYNNLIDVSVKPLPTTLNIEHNCPILGFNNLGDLIYYPKLEVFKIGSVYSAKDIYIDLYNWIVKYNNPEFPDKRSDIEKIESHGFDRKISFRKM